jgi:catechol 2,3-dioxygenase-like lactoylglutathione lyase family enzyme
LKRRFTSFVWLIALTAALPLPAQQQALARSVDSVNITVSDMDRAVAFYSGVLAFEKMSDVEVAGSDYEHLEGVFGLRMRVVRMRLGEESIELTQFLAPRGRSIPEDSRSNDRWFQHIAIIVSDMDRAFAILRQNHVEFASTGPQRLPDWNKSAAGIEAFYFKDPDGHPLEILHFPPDKGLPKWHEARNPIIEGVPSRAGNHEAPRNLFLGIDHTAIVVADTDTSLKFYRDLLGMHIAGTSENYGVEQEHLNNVFGARLRITSLRAENGPGVELLEYLAPRDGRPFPIDEHANDIVHRQTQITVSDLSTAEAALRAKHVSETSAGIVDLTGMQLGFKRAVLARDPDGHPVELEEPENSR